MSNAYSLQTPNVTLAGVTLPVSQAIFLTATIDASNDYDTLRRNGVAYQVPAGYKLQILAMQINPTTAATCSVGFGSSTAIATSQVAAPAGWSQIVSGGGGPTYGVTPATLGMLFETALFIEVAAGNYATVFASGIPVIKCLCRLVKV